MTKPQIICDNCGKTKGETNHWFRAVDVQSRAMFVEPAETLNNSAVKLNEAAIYDLCGQGCVHSWVDKWLTERGASK